MSYYNPIPIDINCTSLNVSVPDCIDILCFPTNLSDLDIIVYIYDAKGRVWSATAHTDTDGFVDLDLTQFPRGLFNPFAGDFLFAVVPVGLGLSQRGFFASQTELHPAMRVTFQDSHRVNYAFSPVNRFCVDTGVFVCCCDTTKTNPCAHLLTSNESNSAGTPCVPQLFIAPGVSKNYYYNGPTLTELPAPFNVGNGKLTLLPLTVTRTQCCIDSVTVTLLAEPNGVFFENGLQTNYVSPTLATIPNVSSYAFDVWLNYDDSILLPLVDADGWYTFKLQFATDACGTWEATLRAPVTVNGGGFVELLSFIQVS